MKARALSAKLRRLEAKVVTRWQWELPLWCWPEGQRTQLFAAIVHRPGWVATWPEARDAWLCRALEHSPHLFTDHVLEAIAMPAPLLAAGP